MPATDEGKIIVNAAISNVTSGGFDDMYYSKPPLVTPFGVS